MEEQANPQPVRPSPKAAAKAKAKAKAKARATPKPAPKPKAKPGPKPLPARPNVTGNGREETLRFFEPARGRPRKGGVYWFEDPRSGRGPPGYRWKEPGAATPSSLFVEHTLAGGYLVHGHAGVSLLFDPIDGFGIAIQAAGRLAEEFALAAGCAVKRSYKRSAAAMAALTPEE